MNYDALKQKLTDLQRALAQCRNNLDNYEKQGKSLEQEEMQIQQSFESTLSEESNKELQEYVNNLSEPIANKVGELEEELLELEERYEEEMSKLSGEDLTDYYYSEAEMLEDVQKTLAMLNERLVELIGERFQKELNEQLNSVTFKIQEEDLEEICEYFEKLTTYFENVQNKSGKFATVENVVKKLNTVGNALETGNKQLTLIVLIVLCFVFYMAFKFVFPIYVVALATFAIYNVKLSNKIYTTSLLRKVIEDNLSAIEQMYKDKALAQLNQEKSNLEQSYQDTKNELENELKDTKNKLESLLMSARERFQFDDNKLKEDKDDLLIVNRNRKLELERVKLEEKQKYDSLLKEIEKTKVQFNQVADSLKNKYLNCDKVGDSYIMDSNFLLDIDTATKKPKFFEFNFGSNLFLYNNLDDVVNFIRLFVVQVRARLKPSCINMTVFDDKFMGKDYLCFRELEDEKYDNVMKILINKEELKEYVNELSEISITRTTNIKREFHNIVEYNQFMLSQNSLPESYTFFFVQDIDINTLLETKFRQIILNGSDLGIYTFVFLNIDNFSKGLADIPALAQNFSKRIVVPVGVGIATDYIPEDLAKSQNLSQDDVIVNYEYYSFIDFIKRIENDNDFVTNTDGVEIGAEGITLAQITKMESISEILEKLHNSSALESYNPFYRSEELTGIYMDIGAKMDSELPSSILTILNNKFASTSLAMDFKAIKFSSKEELISKKRTYQIVGSLQNAIDVSILREVLPIFFKVNKEVEDSADGGVSATTIANVYKRVMDEDFSSEIAFYGSAATESSTAKSSTSESSAKKMDLFSQEQQAQPTQEPKVEPVPHMAPDTTKPVQTEEKPQVQPQVPTQSQTSPQVPVQSQTSPQDSTQESTMIRTFCGKGFVKMYPRILLDKENKIVSAIIKTIKKNGDINYFVLSEEEFNALYPNLFKKINKAMAIKTIATEFFMQCTYTDGLDNHANCVYFNSKESYMGFVQAVLKEL